MNPSTLKQFLVYIGIVALGFFALDRTIAFGLQHVVRQSEFRFARLYRGGLEADVVVLGNSRSVNAFFAPKMEKELGKRVFHLGYNGMSMEIGEALLKDYLDHNETPELLILEVTNLRTPNDLLKDLKTFSGLSPRLARLMRSDAEQLSVACEVANVFRFNGEMFLRCLYYWGDSDQAWINSGEIDPEFASDYRPSEEDQGNELYTTSGANWRALMAIIEVCREEGIEVRLIASPYLPNFRNNLLNYDQWVNRFKSELPSKTVFFDFTDSLESAESFADVVHINRAGSLILLEEMIEANVFESRVAIE